MSNSKYTTIAGKIRNAYKNQNRELLTEALNDMYVQFLSYQTAIEIKNKVCKPLEERYLEVIHVDSSTSRLTINPIDGRVTLKISDKCSESTENYFKELARKLMSEEVPATPLRGRIKFHNNGYECDLLSESKKIKHFVRVEE